MVVTDIIVFLLKGHLPLNLSRGSLRRLEVLESGVSFLMTRKHVSRKQTLTSCPGRAPPGVQLEVIHPPANPDG